MEEMRMKKMLVLAAVIIMTVSASVQAADAWDLVTEYDGNQSTTPITERWFAGLCDLSRYHSQSDLAGPMAW